MTVLPNHTTNHTKRYRKRTNNDMSLTYEGGKTKRKTETRGDVFPYCTGNKHFDKLGEKTKTRKHKETHGNRKHEGGEVGAAGVGWGDISKKQKESVHLATRPFFFSPLNFCSVKEAKLIPNDMPLNHTHTPPPEPP
jgi:hypothetical protein